MQTPPRECVRDKDRKKRHISSTFDPQEHINRIIYKTEMLTPRVGHLGSLQISARYELIGRNTNLSFYLRSQTSILLPLRVLKILRGSTLWTDLVVSYHDVPSLHSRCCNVL